MIFSVPVLLSRTADAPEFVNDPVAVPEIVSVIDVPPAPANTRQFADPVTIEPTATVLPVDETVNDPPATAVAPAVDLKLLTVIFWSIVTALPLA